MPFQFNSSSRELLHCRLNELLLNAPTQVLTSAGFSRIERFFKECQIFINTNETDNQAMNFNAQRKVISLNKINKLTLLYEMLNGSKNYRVSIYILLQNFFPT